VPLEAATEATMHDCVLSLPPHERRDGRHKRAAVACAVPRSATVDVPRIQARRTVIPVAPARRRCADHELAVTAPELFASAVNPPFAALLSTMSIRP
jgi:hypothetical protein